MAHPSLGFLSHFLGRGKNKQKGSQSSPCVCVCLCRRGLNRLLLRQVLEKCFCPRDALCSSLCFKYCSQH